MGSKITTKLVFIWMCKVALAALLLYGMVVAFSLGFYAHFDDRYRLYGLSCFLCAAAILLVRIFWPRRFLWYVIAVCVMIGTVLTLAADRLYLRDRCAFLMQCEKVEHGFKCHKDNDALSFYGAVLPETEQCQKHGYWSKENDK